MADPSADDDRDATSEQVLVALRRIIRAVDLHSKLLLERHGLTSPQIVVLKTLLKLGEATVGELARRVHLSQATTTGILTRLEKRGLVTRNRSDVDRRRVVVTGTSQAADLLKKAPPPLQEQFLVRFRQIEEWERTLILSSLQRIVSMMEADRLDATAMLVTGPIEEPLSTQSPEAGHVDH